MKTRIAALVLALGLAGCAGMSAQVQVWQSCQIYDSALLVLTPLAVKMSQSQIDSVRTAKIIGDSVCIAPKPKGTATELLLRVRDALNRLAAVQGGLSP